MLLIETDAVHMVQMSALRRANVVEDRARCGRSSRLAREAKTFEREHTKMIFQQRNGMVGGEDPILEWSLSVSSAYAIVCTFAIEQRG